MDIWAVSSFKQLGKCYYELSNTCLFMNINLHSCWGWIQWHSSHQGYEKHFARQPTSLRSYLEVIFSRLKIRETTAIERTPLSSHSWLPWLSTQQAAEVKQSSDASETKIYGTVWLITVTQNQIDGQHTKALFDLYKRKHSRSDEQKILTSINSGSENLPPILSTDSQTWVSLQSLGLSWMKGRLSLRKGCHKAKNLYYKPYL